MSKFCPIIKEDCKGDQCAFMGDFDKECIVVNWLVELTTIPSALEEINQRLENIGNYMFTSSEE